jgi:heme-degrading monooxygenase HmoA
VNQIVDTPKPPYYAVIAPAELSEDIDGYGEMALKMIELAKEQPGFLGIETAIMGDFVMAVSYWESMEAIDGWSNNARHLIAKNTAKERWFARYLTRIARVEACY